LLLGLWSWQVFDYGRRYEKSPSIPQTMDQDRSSNRIDQLMKKLESWRFKAINAERTGQIDRGAVDKSREEIRQLQDERAELQKQVMFLKGLIESGDGPLQVKNFKLTQNEEEEDPRLYNYAFKVTQTITNTGKVKGEIRIRVEGILNGDQVELPLSSLRKDKQKAHKMGFSQFQDINGSLRLPENFKPVSFVAEVRPTGKKLKQVTQMFDWMTGDATE